MNADQFLVELYKEEQTHARHTEVQRLEVTKFILVAVGVLIGLMASLKFSIYCIPFGVLIVALGFIGNTVTSTFVKRFDDHRNRARAFRREIDKLVSPAGKAELVLGENRMDKTDRLRSFWERINRGIMLVGAVCLLCNLLAVWTRVLTDNTSHAYFERILHQLQF
jgi:fatty acid desaturase